MVAKNKKIEFENHPSGETLDKNVLLGSKEYVLLGKDEAGRDIWTYCPQRGYMYALTPGKAKAVRVEAIKPKLLEEGEEKAPRKKKKFNLSQKDYGMNQERPGRKKASRRLSSR